MVHIENGDSEPNNSAVEEIAGPSAKGNSNAGVYAHNKPNEYEEHAPEWFIDLKPKQKASMVIQFTLAAIGLIAVIIYGGQLAIMREQLKEMHDGGIDTHSLSEAAQSQAVAAKNNAQAARDFADTVVSINKGIGEAVKRLDSQAKASQESVGVAQVAMRIDQRAWVDFSQINPVAEDQTGQLGATTQTNNFGKTPALNMRHREEIEPLPVGQPPDFPLDYTDAFLWPRGSKNIMPPNIPAEGTQWSKSPADFKIASSKRATYYLHGRLVYDDIFGKHHWRVFCFYWQSDPLNPSQIAYTICSSHNEIDTEKE